MTALPVNDGCPSQLVYLDKNNVERCLDCHAERTYIEVDEPHEGCSWRMGPATCQLCGAESHNVWCACADEIALECGSCGAFSVMPDPLEEAE